MIAPILSVRFTYPRTDRLKADTSKETYTPKRSYKIYTTFDAIALRRQYDIGGDGKIVVIFLQRGLYWRKPPMSLV